MNPISHTDLILNPDGSIYHLHLLPGDIADQIILVGDPGRVAQVSSHFDHIELIKSNREFVTHTGSFKGKRITVLSTGIGTDNIDIVLNELDALVNVDLEQRTIKSDHRSLKLIRIGTSGALHADIAPGEQIIARIAGGFDGLYHFYKDPGGINLEALAKHLWFTLNGKRVLQNLTLQGVLSICCSSCLDQAWYQGSLCLLRDFMRLSKDP